jgi:hypothetical protein
MAKTYLVKIGSTELDGYLKQNGLIVERNKLWTDADRNLNGDLKATFIGVFPKLTLEFTYLTEAQMKTITGLLDDSSFTVSWWNSKIEDYTSATYYAGDYSYPVFNKEKGTYESWGVSLIPFSKV